MSERIASYEEFWPRYLEEHRDPRSRRLHFLGTTGWLAACAGSTVTAPLTFPLAFGAMVGLAAHATKKGEADKPRWAHFAGMLALPSLAAPLAYPAGVAFAYACAWTGHYGMQKNRPLTFEYPVWSMVSDLRMWSHMARGKWWTGDPSVEVVTPDGAAERPETSGPTVQA
jgi:hypothetical protein